VAIYDAAMHEALAVESLPTVIVLDRRRRVRGRLSHYGADIEEKVRGLVKTLLTEEPAGPAEPLAPVDLGAGLLTVAWSREAPGLAEGLAFVPGDPPRLVVLAGRKLVSLSPDGMHGDDRRAPPGAGRLRPSAVAAGRLLAFRAGAPRVVGIEGDAPEQAWDAPSPVLDLEPFEGAGDRPGGLLLAARDGLYLAAGDRAPVERIEGPREVLDLAVADDGVALLEPGGALTWLDRSLRSPRRVQVDGAAGRLVADGDAVVAAPRALVAAARGRFLRDARASLALASADGSLALADSATGEVRWRAHWPGIVELAAGDLVTGDGERDELIVLTAKRVTVLAAAPSPPGP
jgi:hypothetical protein